MRYCQERGQGRPSGLANATNYRRLLMYLLLNETPPCEDGDGWSVDSDSQRSASRIPSRNFHRDVIPVLELTQQRLGTGFQFLA